MSSSYKESRRPPSTNLMSRVANQSGPVPHFTETAGGPDLGSRLLVLENPTITQHLGLSTPIGGLSDLQFEDPLPLMASATVQAAPYPPIFMGEQLD